jgi:hypothetical protein
MTCPYVRARTPRAATAFADVSLTRREDRTLPCRRPTAADRRRAAAAAGLLAILAAAPAAAQTQDLPAPLAAFAAERAAECAGLGGTPSVGPAFATPVDLNGDGAADYIVDLAGIECANAWSAFCGSAGCPVSIWIAGPGGLTREWDGYAQAWSIDPQGAAMGVVVERHGTACPGAASGTETCRERLVFAAPDPAPAATAAAAPTDAAPDAAADAPEDAPEAEPAPQAAALGAPGAPGWTLREVPGATPVAVSDGPGAFAAIAVFCLSGQPFLAATLREPPPGETAQIEFAFSGASVSSTATREDQAGGALVIDLADRPLAGLLAGRDSEARVALDGADQGVLSLRGSTRAIRSALASCTPP